MTSKPAGDVVAEYERLLTAYSQSAREQERAIAERRDVKAFAAVDKRFQAALVLAALARVDSPEQQLASEVLCELQRARTKFPGKNVTTLALVEEVGELAKATFEESRERVRKEAVQVATMAMRVVLDGDSTLDGWRAVKGLDSLTTTVTVDTPDSEPSVEAPAERSFCGCGIPGCNGHPAATEGEMSDG